MSLSVTSEGADTTDLKRFVSFGEALTDLVHTEADKWQSCNGGAPWNVALGLQSLGVASAFGGCISRDVFGDALHRASDQAGLDLRYLQRSNHSPLLAVVHQVSPPQYFFVGDDSADLHFDPVNLPTGWQCALDWAHFGGISLAREPLAGCLIDLAAQLKARGKKISFDPNFRELMTASFDSSLEKMCELADIIKVSDEDLRGLFRTSDVATALMRIRAFNPAALVMVTHGAAPADLYHRSSHFQATPPAVQVVDTVGAGDAAMAGLLGSQILRPGVSLLDHLKWAVAAGAVACGYPGAHAASRCQIEAMTLKVSDCVVVHY